MTRFFAALWRIIRRPKAPRRKHINYLEHLRDLPTTYAPDRPTNSGLDQWTQDQLARVRRMDGDMTCSKAPK